MMTETRSVRVTEGAIAVRASRFTPVAPGVVAAGAA